MQQYYWPPSRLSIWQWLQVLGVITLLAVFSWLLIDAVSTSQKWPLHDALWSDAMRDEEKTVLSAAPQPAQLEPLHSVFYNKFYRGDRSKKQVALTFDDGPHPLTTPLLLSVLRKYNVKATFFLVGERVDQYPELARAEVAEGHSIQNHTYHHERLPILTKEQLMEEVRRCSESLKKITGKTPRCFRPPGGTFDPRVMNIIQSMGYVSVLWTLNPGDFQRPPVSVIEDRVLRGVENGTIILLHDGGRPTVDALPDIISTLQQRGYEFVTIDQMLDDMHFAPPPAVTNTVPAETPR